MTINLKADVNLLICNLNKFLLSWLAMPLKIHLDLGKYSKQSYKASQVCLQITLSLPSLPGLTQLSIVCLSPRRMLSCVIFLPHFPSSNFFVDTFPIVKCEWIHRIVLTLWDGFRHPFPKWDLQDDLWQKNGICAPLSVWKVLHAI